MKLRIHHFGLIAASMVFLTASSRSVQACGLEWNAPHEHFDGVDEQGHVLFVDTIGTLNLGSTLGLPIYAMFKSDWETSSPYLGQGWMLPILESRIVQVDENTFQLWQPDGWYQYMVRSKPTDTVLNGQGGWKAEISGDTITAWADCGWKLTYSRGKITSMTTPDGQKLDYIYVNDQVTEVQKNGQVLIHIDSDDSKFTRKLTIGDKQLSIQLADKPNVVSIDGKNAVGRLDKSLSKISSSDDDVRSYLFTVNSKLQPTLKVLGPNAGEFTWDPIAKSIISDGKWTYTSKPNPGGDVEISRKNSLGQTELWDRNLLIGEETAQLSDGAKKVIMTFPNGPMIGKTRKVTETSKDGKIKYSLALSYNENGRLIDVYDDNQRAWSATYDQNGDTLTQEIPNDKNTTYKYDQSGSLLEKDITLADHSSVSFFYNGRGFLTESKSANEDIKYTYDSSGKLQSRSDLLAGKTWIRSPNEFDNAVDIAQEGKSN